MIIKTILKVATKKTNKIHGLAKLIARKKQSLNKIKTITNTRIRVEIRSEAGQESGWKSLDQSLKSLKPAKGLEPTKEAWYSKDRYKKINSKAIFDSIC